MIWVDWGILFVVVVSVLIGLFRGFTREVLGLLTWVAALWLAWVLGDNLAQRLESSISVPQVRMAAAYGLLFLAGLIGGSIATFAICRTVKESPFARTDRVVGAGFGLLRGLALVAVFVLFAGMTSARQDDWWKKSVLIGHVEWLADGLARVIPAAWLESLKPGV
ncbi:MAG: CvpA family protein [Gammaproteobacteria bacterium]|nr:CvpA family protein [Gammaproteobacteria bacterium]